MVACCAMRTSDQPSHLGALPCLWKRLSRIVSKTRDKQARKLHINDSKLVYNSGLKELERTVLCLLAQAHASQPLTLGDVLRCVDPTVADAVRGYRWYADQLDARYPIEVEAASWKISANAWSIECEKALTHCCHYAGHVLLEKQFNQLVDKTRNKASASFSLVARHIDTLMRRFAGEKLVIVCDRQGGREHYGHLLRLMFEDWSLVIQSESPQRADYLLVQSERQVRILFCEKAESIALPVAAASMLAKYTREALMYRFNRYWQQHRPELTPTAGYYTDGWRFLRDIQDIRAQLGVCDSELIRSR